MLEIRNLKKTYGNYHALDGLDLTIPEGSLFGLVGPNGAGKTTAIKIMSGLLLPDEGEVFISGINAVKEPDRIRELIGYVPDSFGIYDNLMVWEYMEFFAAAFGLEGITARKRCENLLAQVGLEDKREFHVDALSRGMQQRLCLARALIHDPQFIIMDEPTASLTAAEVNHLFGVMRKLREKGIAMIFISHKLNEVMEICDRYTILRNGVLVQSGRIAETYARQLSSSMVGHEIDANAVHQKAAYGDEVLRLEHLSDDRHFFEIST